MLETLILENVDLKKLEEQRLILHTVHKGCTINSSQERALDGIVNMLDVWSDNIYFGNKNEKS